MTGDDGYDDDDFDDGYDDDVDDAGGIDVADEPPGDAIAGLERSYWEVRRRLTDPDDDTPPHERARLRREARQKHLDVRIHRSRHHP
jgi:hypothetical protein